MNLLNRILLARFELQAALGVTGNAVAAALDVPNGWVATGNVIMLAWMAFAARFAYGKSLEEFDEVFQAEVETRSTEKIQAAVAKQIPGATPEKRDSLESFVTGLGL